MRVVGGQSPPHQPSTMEFRMFARLASLALAACALNTNDALGQVYYGGYNLGPDYGAMAQQGMARLNEIVNQANQEGANAVQRTMQDPRCKAMYRQHQQQGGRLSFEQFAYEYARTGGFTAQGKARAFQVEQDNQAKEKQAHDGLMEARSRSAAAVAQWQSGFHQNLAEQGNIMAGNRTYVGPNGQHFTLPYTQPGYYNDPASGTVYHLDQFGRYHYMQNNSGWWVPLQPAR